MHVNIQLKADKLFQLKLISTRNAEQLLSQLTCDVNQKDCMYRECDVCQHNSLTFLVLLYFRSSRIKKTNYWTDKVVRLEK